MTDAEAKALLAGAVPANVREVCATLTRAGHQAVTVGGAVRDALLGRAPGDWDVATSAHPDQVLALFRHTVPTGLQHGTVTIVTGRGEASHVEVTTFRGEGAYTDARRPDHVVFGVPLVEDLARRDLVVNAMAYDPATDELHDPFGGRADIAAKRLRAVGTPVDRFTEDGLRVMRAVRFAAVLAFDLDPDTEAGIRPALPSLAKVSRERVADELRKILGTQEPSRALRVAARTGIVRSILPALAIDSAPPSGGAARSGKPDLAIDSAPPSGGAARSGKPDLAIDSAPPSGGAARSGKPDLAIADVEAWCATIDAATVRTRLAALLVPLAKPTLRLDRTTGAEDILRALKFSTDECRVAAALVGVVAATAEDDRAVRWLLSDVRRPLAPLAVELWRAHGATELADRAAAIVARGDAIAVNELALMGRELMDELALQPGPVVGRLLELLLSRVIEDPTRNTRDQLVELARGLILELR